MIFKKSRIVQISKITELKDNISKDIPIIIIKNFVTSKDCYDLVNNCTRFSKKYLHRKRYKNGMFYSLDIHPQNVKTDRIFRTFYLPKSATKKFGFIDKIMNIQKKIITKLRKSNTVRLQVIHYPVGGGFFGLHKHKRFPTNYGIILNLSKKGKDFNFGSTNFIYKNKIIKSDTYADQGDFILFRYDLSHSVESVDKNNDLIFNNKGRWTLIFPVFG